MNFVDVTRYFTERENRFFEESASKRMISADLGIFLRYSVFSELVVISDDVRGISLKRVNIEEKRRILIHNLRGRYLASREYASRCFFNLPIISSFSSNLYLFIYILRGRFKITHNSTSVIR